jgi:methylated-DNA-protein-cysteine methyltransferase related protein
MGSCQQIMDSEKTDFRSWALSVCKVIQGIPRGHVLTYGEVARLAGPGGSARRVSMAMRYAPAGTKLPWHRVINAQGKISFPMDSAEYREQKKKLEGEGVRFRNGSVNLDRYGYQGALDALVWGLPPGARSDSGLESTDD